MSSCRRSWFFGKSRIQESHRPIAIVVVKGVIRFTSSHTPVFLIIAPNPPRTLPPACKMTPLLVNMTPGMS